MPSKALEIVQRVLSRTPIVYLVLHLLASFCCGTYSLYLFFTRKFGDTNGVRFFVAQLYTLALSVTIPAAELGMMQHPHLVPFTRMLTGPVGLVFTYIFMGGILLGQGVGGWIVGIFCIVVGLLGVLMALFNRRKSAMPEPIEAPNDYNDLR